MARREPKSLFRRLTRLFRSGPVVKRKIRALDTTIAVADKTKSSGTLLFQKSLSPTYATITSNAYNLSERLMRYQDFQEMEYTPEIAAAMDIYADETCLTKESIVSTPEGDFTIEQLHRMQLATSVELNDQPTIRRDGLGRFPVYSYDGNRRSIVVGWAHDVRLTGTQVPVVKVTFDDGTSLRCTSNHRIMLRDGSYVQASDLVPGTALMPFKTRWMGRKGHEYPYIYTMDREKTRSGWRAQHLFNYEALVGPVPSGHVIHHKDLDRSNHRLSNLQLMGELEHQQHHARINNRNKLGSSNEKHSKWMLENNPGAIDRPSLADMRQHLDLSMAQFMARFGATYSTLQAWVRAHGYENWNAFVDGTASPVEAPTRGVNSLTVDAIRQAYVPGDSKSRVVMRLGCSVNVLDKFLNRKLGTTWSQLVEGFGGSSLGSGGRPKGSHGSTVSYQDICNATQPGRYVTQQGLASSLGVSISVVQLRLQEQGFPTFTAWADAYHNHKVTSVEPDGCDDVYDLTVDEHHNFACNGTFVHNCAQDEKGRVLHVYSDNEKIRELLEDLFYNVLNVEFNMRSWARNLVKYGDFFLYNDVSPEYGVINAFPIPVNEIEREENYDRDDPFAVRYRWVTLGNRTLENWEVTHFRLLGNDMFLPYGSSIIEPARRIWRQLILIEDAMLVYRVVRAPERRVFYVDVANLPPGEVNTYIEQQRQQMRTTPVVDSQSGRVDLRYNPMSVEEDFFVPVRGGESGTRIDTLAGGQNTAAVEDVAYIQKKLFAALKIPRAYLGYDELLSCLVSTTCIPLLDGTSVTIGELSDRFALGNNGPYWVYSVDPSTGDVIPGRVTNAWKTKEISELYEVTTDAGTVRCTGNHPFLCRDGTYKRADELGVGQSLMPLYRRISVHREKGGNDYLHGYEMVLQPNQKWEYTHRIVGKYVHPHLRPKNVIHHVDFNKRNNSPSNLQFMDSGDVHRRFHADLNKANKTYAGSGNPRFNRSLTIDSVISTIAQADVCKKGDLLKGLGCGPTALARLLRDNNTTYRQLLAMNHPDIRLGGNFRRAGYSDITIQSVLDAVASGCTSRGAVARFIGTSDAVVIDRVKSAGYSGWNDFKSRCITMLSKDALAASLLRHGSGQKAYIAEYASICSRSAFMMNVRLHFGGVKQAYATLSAKRHLKPINHKVTGIRVVKLDVPVPVFDLEVEGTHNFAVQLDPPGTDPGSQEFIIVHNSKATLAQEDIRFSRTINVIQKTMMAELNKLAIIHLYAHGFESEDLQNFVLRLSNPSTVAQQQKLELWRAKFEIAGSSPEGMSSKRFIRKEIWGLNDEQIEALDEERMKERQIDDAIEAGTASNGEEGGADDADEDLFGGGMGGGAGGAGGAEGGDEGGDGEGGEAPAGGDEKPPEENAGDEPEEETEPETVLLTGADDRDDDESFALKLPDLNDGQPVKAKSQLQKALYNRGRRRTHGASKTHMPDFRKMTSTDSRSMEDPYDNDFLKSVTSNPFAEALSPTVSRGRLSSDILSSLGRMAASDRFKQGHVGVLQEGNDVQAEIDGSANGVFDLDLLESGSTPGGRLDEGDELLIVDDEDDE